MYKNIRFGEDVCGNLKVALEKEWFEANGLGGYASSTIIGAHTRRYHGLLVAASEETRQRTVLLSKCEEQIFIGDESYYLSCNIYPNAIHPTGFMYLKEFYLYPFPTFIYQIGEVKIEKKIFMIYGENTVVITYHIIEGADEITLKIRPLITCRSHHHLMEKTDKILSTYQVRANTIEYRPYKDSLPFFLKHNGLLIEGTHLWYNNFLYTKETERGFKGEEDLFNPFEISYMMGNMEGAFLIASTHDRTTSNIETLENNERERRKRTVMFNTRHGEQVRTPTISSAGYSYLLQAADAFIVRNKEKGKRERTIAGYPWLDEWGRDTMISLTGLTLITGKFLVAQNILKRYASLVKEGKMPHCFSDSTGEAMYHSIETSLWFFYAIYKYVEYTQDMYFVVHELYESMKEIVRFFINGGDSSVYMDHDGLIYCTNNNLQNDIFGAQTNDAIMTPRHGKMVDINALWFNAIKIIEYVSYKCKQEEDHLEFKKCALKIKANFSSVFWNGTKGCLYDFIAGSYKDPAVRPHQLFAVGLPFTLLAETEERGIVEIVERDLLTMHGLRSLSPRDTHYIGRYKGNWYSRDVAYHQGTIWPHLIGFFLDAYCKVNGFSETYRKECEAHLRPLFYHILHDAGLGYISEIFDGDFPHSARGCVAHSASVAEVLRAYHEYVLTKRPLSHPIHA
ncbi:MAG: amylo-alpha-1,6-glucosidase [Candidatus Omnitrophota bacterium]